MAEHTIHIRYTSHHCFLASNDRGKKLILPYDEWVVDDGAHMCALVVDLMTEDCSLDDVVRVEFIVDQYDLSEEEFIHGGCDVFARAPHFMHRPHVMWYSCFSKHEAVWDELVVALLEYEEKQGRDEHLSDIRYNPSILEERRNTPVTIATDASRSHYGKKASWAFVPQSEGLDKLLKPSEKSRYGYNFYRAGMMETLKIGDAEMMALVRAYLWGRGKTNALIILQTDSEQAYRYLCEDSSKYLSMKDVKGFSRHALHELKKEVQDGTVHIEKVKAHDVHELNNKVDRVAFAYRRATEANITGQERHNYVIRSLENMMLENA